MNTADALRKAMADYHQYLDKQAGLGGTVKAVVNRAADKVGGLGRKPVLKETDQALNRIVQKLQSNRQAQAGLSGLREEAVADGAAALADRLSGFKNDLVGREKELMSRLRKRIDLRRAQMIRARGKDRLLGGGAVAAGLAVPAAVAGTQND